MNKAGTIRNIRSDEDFEIDQQTNKPSVAAVPEISDDIYNRQKSSKHSNVDVKHTIVISPEDYKRAKGSLPDTNLENGFSDPKDPQKETSYHSDCTMENILREIGLYEELYEHFHDLGLNCESLSHMKEKHIDYVFRNMSIHLKIIFEHRIMEWQRKHRLKFKDTMSLEISQRRCETEGQCQLLTIKDSNTTTTNYHIPETNNLIKLPMRLLETMRNALDTTLQEFRTRAEHDKDHDVEKNSLASQHVTCNNQKIELVANDFCETGPKKSHELSNKNGQITGLKQIKPSNQVVNNHKLEPSLLYNRKRKWGLETELREILLMYKSGNILLETYQGFGAMTPEMRAELVHILVDHFVINHEYLSVPQCRKLADDIIELFPTECLETYFLQETRSCTPKGKLWDRYQNQRQRQKKSLNALLNPPNIVYTRQDRPEMELLCSELKFLNDEKRLLRSWNKTYHFRRYQLQSEHFASWKLYFDEYPFCKQPNYSQFIDADLDVLYPNIKFDENLWDEFLNNFKLYYWNRITHAKSRQLFDELISADDITEKSDYFELKIIELLHAVLNNNPDIVEEAQEQFTIEVPDLGELKKTVMDRKKFCLDNGIQCKPFIAVVGQNRCYEHFSVVLDSTGFSCDSYQESVILCFKLYLFFDLCYSDETLNTWIFIQKYFFNKHSLMKNDIVDTFIFDIRSTKQVNFK